MHENHGKTRPGTAYDAHGILMQTALDQAAQAAAHGDVPVGALVAAPDNAIIGTGHNRSEYSNDPCLHAEIIALREACAALRTPRLDRCTLISTLEPCAMCAGAIVNARISRVVFAAWDLKSGAAGSVLDVLRNRLLPHTAEVIGGIREEESVALLQKFFDGKRRKNIPFIC